MGVTQFSISSDGSYASSGWNMLNGASTNSSQSSGSNNFGTPGFVSVYYNGTTYNGPAFSVLNGSSSQIASVFYTYDAGGQEWDPSVSNSIVNASGPASNTTNVTTNVIISVTTNILSNYYTNKVVSNVITTTVSYTNSNPAIATTNYFTNTITNNVAFSVPYQTNLVTNTSSILTTNVTSNSIASSGTITKAGGGYNYYDGNWTATLKNSYPNQVFNGNGVMSLGQPNNPTSPSPINQPNGGNNVIQIPFTVSGTRVSSATSQIF